MPLSTPIYQLTLFQPGGWERLTHHISTGTPKIIPNLDCKLFLNRTRNSKINWPLYCNVWFMFKKIQDNTNSEYRGFPHFVISQFVIPAISWFFLRPNFMILKKKIFFFSENFLDFLDFFFVVVFNSYFLLIVFCLYTVISTNKYSDFPDFSRSVTPMNEDCVLH